MCVRACAVFLLDDAGNKNGRDVTLKKATRFVCSVAGVTRNSFEGKRVVRLEYEAYKPMAEREMKKICDQMRERWSVKHIAMLHRIGSVDREVCQI